MTDSKAMFIQRMWKDGKDGRRTACQRLEIAAKNVLPHEMEAKYSSDGLRED
jgi:hypothetical protein